MPELLLSSCLYSSLPPSSRRLSTPLWDPNLLLFEVSWTWMNPNRRTRCFCFLPYGFSFIMLLPDSILWRKCSLRRVGQPIRFFFSWMNSWRWYLTISFSSEAAFQLSYHAPIINQRIGIGLLIHSMRCSCSSFFASRCYHFLGWKRPIDTEILKSK